MRTRREDVCKLYPGRGGKVFEEICDPHERRLTAVGRMLNLSAWDGVVGNPPPTLRDQWACTGRELGQPDARDLPAGS
jgi:hypothetical protein